MVSDPRQLLESERELTVQRLAALTDDFAGVVAASRDTNADDEHDPEGATIAFERSQVDALVRQARAHLEEIDAALGRVAAVDVRDLRALRRTHLAGAARGQADGAHLCHMRDDCGRAGLACPS